MDKDIYKIILTRILETHQKFQFFEEDDYKKLINEYGEDYVVDAMSQLSKAGYITGVTDITGIGEETALQFEDVDITPTGINYLKGR